jgi:hypothetical protein
VYSRKTAIVNMGDAHNCPSDIAGYCDISHECYGKNPERIWKGVVKYRRKQGRCWREATPDQLVALTFYLHKKYEVERLRFNEVSDFWSQLDVDKLNVMADNGPLKIFGYTANKYLDYKNASFCLKLSHFGELIEGTTGNTVVIPKHTDPPKGYILCPKTVKKMRCDDGGCGICFSKNKTVNVAFWKHG